MKLIRTIICDDEEPARNRIKKLLKNETNFLIIAEAKNGLEALALAEDLKPDLIFLDIQMPDLTGIKVVEQIKNAQMPFIVFTTAYDQYAIKAFELFALDYLLKPFDNKRFKQSLERIRSEINDKQKTEFSERLINLVNSYNSGSETDTFLIIREKGIVKKVMVKDISHVQSYSNYLKLFTRDDIYLYRASFDQLQKECSGDWFIRVHRSYLINKKFIGKVNYLTNHEFRITLADGKEIKSGRHYYQVISDYLSN